MSVLAAKHVLVIGDETPQIHNIETALEKEGAIIHTSTCKATSPDILEADHIHAIFINHLHEKSHCVELLAQIKERRDTKVLPIFALVQDSQSDIEHALSLGAADYFTPEETVQNILDKVQIVLGVPVNMAGNKVIDITGPTSGAVTDGIRVLVVEDDPLLGNLLSSRFDAAKYSYKLNKSGEGVLKEISEFEPDIIILDLMLPGHSGFEILAEIRANKDSKNLPVFIFSNRDSAEDKQKAKDLGADNFYVKAMTHLSELVERIDQVVGKNK